MIKSHVTKRKWRNVNMKKYLGIFVCVLIIIVAVVVVGHKEISGLFEKATAKEYYVQIQGNEDKEQHPTTSEYKLNAVNKDGETAKIAFSVSDKKLETPVFLRVKVLESKDPEGNHFVKNYEKVKETELLEKVKVKLKQKDISVYIQILAERKTTAEKKYKDSSEFDDYCI